MGAWGYGYRDNDNYYNEAGTFIEPLISGLAEYIEDCSQEDFRIRLNWTVSLLRTSEEQIALPDWCMDVLRTAVEIVRDENLAHAEDWREPEEYRKTVEEELRVIEEWLDRFGKAGMLEDRMGALIEAVSEKDS